MTDNLKSPPLSEDAIYHPEALRLNHEAREKLYHTILEASTLDPEYLTMLVLAALIALLGLLQNSAAVIIGAMLISPLMNPILAGGLALVLGDWKLGRKASAVLGLSVALSILVTWLVSEIVPLRQPTAEILARTNPNLLDLFIAMLSGLAGTLAMRASSAAFTIIPGVAIAVAVVPPLATVGYGLSSGNMSIAAGAFLLFVTNLVSIMISAGVVFLLFGFRARAEAEMGRLKLKYRIAISAAILLVLAVPLVQTLRQAVTQIRIRSGISAALNRTFETPRSSISDLSISRRDGELNIHAVVRTTEYFEDTAIAAAEDSLRRSFGKNTRLEIEQILVTQGGLTAQQAARLRNFISGNVTQPAPVEPPFDLRATGDQILSHLQKNVDEVLVPTNPLFRRIGPVEALVAASQPLRITLHLAAGEPLVPQTVQVLTGQLSTKLTCPVELRARVSLEGDKYYFRIEKAQTREGLSAAERRTLTEFLERIAGQAKLSLDITVANLAEPASEDKPASQREIEALLAHSRLASPQWRVRRAPPPAPASQIPPLGAAAAAPALRVEIRVIQEI
ncbi:MAG: TIGR00341 family protein [Acidobacteria bacterium]|nr:TIGR00341 family protein [Acidobacteriota bacterium]